MDTPERGSILIEQLVALSLMSLMLVGLFSLLTAGALAAQMSSEFSLAGSLAAQKLEEISGSREEPTEVLRQPLDPERFP
ncbi:MAG: type IV pilus modification PilV family protein, partial [bacterium]